MYDITFFIFLAFHRSKKYLNTEFDVKFNFKNNCFLGFISSKFVEQEKYRQPSDMAL